jgi:2-succinyl-6-hydroxy-2,4-cyclohexadiene-1-carboxylate synthase
MMVDAAGVRIHVAFHAGEPEGTPLVLLHGFTGSAATWEPLLPELAAHARTVGFDLVGHGRSDAPEDLRHYSVEAASRQALAVADALGVERADWLGYSMGGRVALHLALDAPHRVRRLVLESCSPGILDAKQREARRLQDEALAARIGKDGLEAFVDAWMAQPLFASQQRMGPAWLSAQRGLKLQQKARGLANSLRGMGQGAMAPLHPRLARLKPPALLVSGALDAKYGALMDDMAAAMPRARRAVVPDAGHAAHAERPEAFLEAVLPFLREA